MAGAIHPAFAGAGPVPADELRGGAYAGAAYGYHDDDCHRNRHEGSFSYSRAHFADADGYPDGLPHPVTRTVSLCDLDRNAN